MESPIALPFESVVKTAIEQISLGVQVKIAQDEEKRNREFNQYIKELEFYKNSYDKELRQVFDYWFDLARATMLTANENLTKSAKEKADKELSQLTSLSTISKKKMDTLKYGGKETCRVLALYSQMQHHPFMNDNPIGHVYLFCKVLSVIKRDILGQDVDPLNIIKVLINDYSENEKEVLRSRKYIEKEYEKY
ncbi:hypothetical protein NE582_06175 [Gordonibacter pamelaeae]|uniref:hypothetical protein n=3 Tax=Gordonibacter pamelaeae TaxID=471189 RepID=UPI0012B1318B|nr:hypothetical protein [Gordonibacter pamelaeae]MCQ4846807.1 hypothetical protein [Gordonibacter pamelaeae]MCQ4849805.1 hypothetical protein [Gordonibacter pamelaeae]MSA61276.1 hypothetical protein [Gordonibacter pamelaeae]